MAAAPDARTAAQLRAISRRLRQTANRDLKRESTRALREVAKPLILETRAAARRDLPQRGGLARRMATRPQTVRIRTGARTTGLAIVLPGAQRGLLGGDMRHPVFGNRSRFVVQQINGEWWDDTLMAGRPRVEEALQGVLDNIARRIAAEGRRVT